jgi:predicted ABC-type ATPase
MAKLFEDNHANFNNTPSPRIAIDITKVYINKGIEFISNFSISTENINQIKAAATREYNIKSLSKLLKEVVL